VANISSHKITRLRLTWCNGDSEALDAKSCASPSDMQRKNTILPVLKGVPQMTGPRSIFWPWTVQRDWYTPKLWLLRDLTPERRDRA
jgi:hypothetical protein